MLSKLKDRLKDVSFIVFLLLIGVLQYGWVIWPKLGNLVGLLSTAVLVVIIAAAFAQHVSSRLKLLLAWAFVIGAPFAIMMAAKYPVAAFELPHQQQPHYENNGKQNESNSRETFWQRTTNDPIALFTFWLVIFTGVLAFSTVGLYRSTKDAALGALKAANVAEMALIGLERPYLYVQITRESGLMEWAGEACIECFEYSVSNCGRTPAILKSIAKEFADVPCGSWPDAITRDNVRHFPEGIVIASAGNTIYVGTPPKRTGVGNDVRDGIKDMLFYGLIHYADFIGGEYVNGFCFRFTGKSGHFLRSGGEKYNYNKKLEVTAHT